MSSIEEINKRHHERIKEANITELSAQSQANIIGNNINYLFADLINNGHFKEAEKYVVSYLGTFQNPQQAIERWINNVNALEILFNTGIKPTNSFSLELISTYSKNLTVIKKIIEMQYSNLEEIATKTRCNRGYYHNPLITSLINNNDNYDCVKFLIDNYPKLLNLGGSYDGIPLYKPVALTPNILKLLIDFYGIKIIYGYKYVKNEPDGLVHSNPYNIYLERVEFMKVILEHENYKYTESDINDINDAEILLNLKLKGYNVSNNKVWQSNINRANVILYNQTNESPIWKAAVDKLDTVKFNKSDLLSLKCLFYNVDNQDEKKIITTILPIYALYCLLNKNYKGLETTSKIIDVNNRRRYDGKHLIHIAIELMDIKAIKLLKKVGCNLDVIVDNKDLRQFVYELKSQVAQLEILKILDE